MDVAVDVEKGKILNVPILKKSPWINELEVNQSINLNDGEVFLCKVKNVLAEEHLCDETISVEERIKTIRPIHTTKQTYFSWDGNKICGWGEAKDKI